MKKRETEQHNSNQRAVSQALLAHTPRMELWRIWVYELHVSDPGAIRAVYCVLQAVAHKRILRQSPFWAHPVNG